MVASATRTKTALKVERKMVGIIRFGLFISIVALIATGFYAHSLNKAVTQQRATISALTGERDALRDKLGMSEKQTIDNAAALKSAEERVKILEAELEAGKKPAGRRR